jgi:hypothetical protein
MDLREGFAPSQILSVKKGRLRGVKPLFLFFPPFTQDKNRILKIHLCERGIKGVSIKINQIQIVPMERVY